MLTRLLDAIRGLLERVDPGCVVFDEDVSETPGVGTLTCSASQCDDHVTLSEQE